MAEGNSIYKTIDQIKTECEQIKNETTAKANSATRVGGAMLDIINHVEQQVDGKIDEKLDEIDETFETNEAARDALVEEKVGEITRIENTLYGDYFYKNFLINQTEGSRVDITLSAEINKEEKYLITPNFNGIRNKMSFFFKNSAGEEVNVLWNGKSVNVVSIIPPSTNAVIESLDDIAYIRFYGSPSDSLGTGEIEIEITNAESNGLEAEVSAVTENVNNLSVEFTTLGNSVTELKDKMPVYTSDKITPNYTKGYIVRNDGTINASISYGYTGAIQIKEGETITLNEGENVYFPTNCSVIYECNENGDYIKTLVNYTSVGSVSYAIATYTSTEDKYIAICATMAQINYRINCIDQAASKQKVDKVVGNVSDIIEGLKAKYDEYPLAIAYSWIQGDEGIINTENHFLYCFKKGFKFVKMDMRLTSDNHIVLCHDDGFTFDEDGRITTYDSANKTLIHDMTYSEVMALEHRSSTGTYQKVASLDRILYLCKLYSVIPFITLRETYTEETINAMIPLLKKYNMVDTAIINCFPSASVTSLKVRGYLPYISISYTTAGAPTTSNIDTISALGNAFLCAPKDSITDEIISYAKTKNIRVTAWAMNSNEFSEILSRGVIGGQMSEPLSIWS